MVDVGMPAVGVTVSDKGLLDEEALDVVGLGKAVSDRESADVGLPDNELSEVRMPELGVGVPDVGLLDEEASDAGVLD